MRVLLIHHITPRLTDMLFIRTEDGLYASFEPAESRRTSEWVFSLEFVMGMFGESTRQLAGPLVVYRPLPETGDSGRTDTLTTHV
jgi:hypothetical protein